MNKKKTILFLLVFIFSIVILYSTYLNKEEEANIVVVSPTCLNNGYTIYEKNGKTQYKNIVPAIGHQFDEWVVLQEPTMKKIGKSERTCNECGEKELQDIYFDTSSLIVLNGDISKISKTNAAKLKAELFYDNVKFDGYVTLKYQGHSSLIYDKKNYTIKFFDDFDCTLKHKFTFNGWNPEHKFILKANYIDVSKSRNLICADIWSQMVSTRTNVNERLLNTSNNGAVDGFPMPVYLNGEFLGMYVLSLHKDDDLFEMKDNRKDGILIINKNDSNESLFKQTVDWENTTSWEVEYSGTDDDLWLKEKLNSFIDFVINSSDIEFKNYFDDYIDVNSLIDYMIAMYTLGLHTNYSKDLILLSYDDDVFISSMYDMENAFGLMESEEVFSTPKHFIPVFDNGLWSSQTESLLWERFINVFFNDISIRYKELRINILNQTNICKIVKSRIESVDNNFNNIDMQLYQNQLFQNTNHLDQIMNYINESLSLLDNIFINN